MQIMSSGPKPRFWPLISKIPGKIIPAKIFWPGVGGPAVAASLVDI